MLELVLTIVGSVLVLLALPWILIVLTKYSEWVDKKMEE